MLYVSDWYGCLFTVCEVSGIILEMFWTVNVIFMWFCSMFFVVLAWLIWELLFMVGVQTPNCIRQTVFDAVALDYQSVTVIVDATAAATPEIHLGMCS